MKLFDLFMYSGEREILELRLNELNSVVDFFVIGISDHSHSGIYKGFDLIDPQLLEKFADKIIIVEIPYSYNPNAWVFEMFSREYLYEKIKDRLEIEDILLINDLDELPKIDILKEQIKDLKYPTVFSGQYFYFCFDLYGRQSNDSILIKNKWKIQSLNIYRQNRNDTAIFKHIPNSSYHFSTVMTPENILKKMKYFAHASECPPELLDINWIKKCIIEKRGSIAKESKMNELKQIEINYETMPKYLVDNLDKFKHLCYNSYIL